MKLDANEIDQAIEQIDCVMNYQLDGAVIGTLRESKLLIIKLSDTLEEIGG